MIDLADDVRFRGETDFVILRGDVWKWPWLCENAVLLL
jgi:hypothetical protein